MNFSRKNAPNVVRLGCVFGDACFDITKAIGADLLEFPRVVFTIEEVLQVKDGLQALEQQLGGLKRSSSGIQSYVFQPSEITFHAPIIHPQKLIGIGLNYKDHVEEIKATTPKEPLLFGMYGNAIIGPNEPIIIPPVSRQVDYEPNWASSSAAGPATFRRRLPWTMWPATRSLTTCPPAICNLPTASGFARNH